MDSREIIFKKQILLHITNGKSDKVEKWEQKLLKKAIDDYYHSEVANTKTLFERDFLIINYWVDFDIRDGNFISEINFNYNYQMLNFKVDDIDYDKQNYLLLKMVNERKWNWKNQPFLKVAKVSDTYKLRLSKKKQNYRFSHILTWKEFVTHSRLKTSLASWIYWTMIWKITSKLWQFNKIRKKFKNKIDNNIYQKLIEENEVKDE